MEDIEVRLLSLRVQQLQEITQWIQQQVDFLEAEVKLRLRLVVEERSELLSRVDPYSNDGKSIADSNF